MTEITFYNDYSERFMDSGSGDIDMRKNNNYGFTLAELLIVVAIIAVLVAISIPIFGTQLERSREAVDAANIRSQYAQVITDAILDGGDVNGKDKYGAVNLKQQQSDWQNTEMGTNLHSIYNEVVGTPAAGGIAWVEYKATDDSTILHYEGGNSSGGSGSGDSSSGGGSSSGSSGTDTGGNTDSGSGGDEGNTVIDKIKQSAGTWPAPGETKSIEKGKAYTLQDGTIYIATDLQNYDRWYTAHYPTEGGYSWLGVKPSGTVISSDKAKEGSLTVTVNYGDIYQDQDGNFYIWKNSDSNPWGAPINDQNWIKLVFD